MDRARETNNWEEEERHDLNNLLPSNLPDDWSREKEVTEEKQMSNGKPKLISREGIGQNHSLTKFSQGGYMYPRGILSLRQMIL